MAIKSDIVSGMGLAMSIVTNLVSKVKEAGGTDEDIHCLATPDGEAVLEKIADIIVSAKRRIFKVLVDYTKSLEEMIQAGKYDWANDDITSDHFSVKGSGQKEVEITLFHFDGNISSDDAIVEMAKRGFRPADPPEILALGAECKELQKQFPIVALGFFWRAPSGSCHVLRLDGDVCGRHLSLNLFGGGWSGDCRFAAVRK